VLSALIAGLMIGASTAEACSIPVFRYALERWPSDLYEAIVLHREPLTDEQQAVVKTLGDLMDKDPPANLRVFVVDLAAEKADGPGGKLWKAEGSPKLPCVVVRYPRWSRLNTTVWSGPLSAEAVKPLVDSPVRREIAKRIVSGDTAVWIFLESGDKKKDDAAKKLLETELRELEKELKLPEQVPEDYRGFAEDVPELKLAFSIVKLSRKDPAEQVLVKILTGTEEDLEEFAGEPMTFPVFGRGRALWALVGKGINEDNIAETCIFLVGPCSCQVKARNPGVDLLLTVDWEAGVVEPLVAEVELPPLQSLSGVAATEKPAQPTPASVTGKEGETKEAAPAKDVSVKPAARAVEAAEAKPPAEAAEVPAVSSTLWRNVAILSALAILGVAAATVILKRRGKRRSAR
jgi:hypothetical protein